MYVIVILTMGHKIIHNIHIYWDAAFLDFFNWVNYFGDY